MLTNRNVCVNGNPLAVFANPAPSRALPFYNLRPKIRPHNTANSAFANSQMRLKENGLGGAVLDLVTGQTAQKMEKKRYKKRTVVGK